MLLDYAILEVYNLLHIKLHELKASCLIFLLCFFIKNNFTVYFFSQQRLHQQQQQHCR